MVKSSENFLPPKTLKLGLNARRTSQSFSISEASEVISKERSELIKTSLICLASLSTQQALPSTSRRSSPLSSGITKGCIACFKAETEVWSMNSAVEGVMPILKTLFMNSKSLTSSFDRIKKSVLRSGRGISLSQAESITPKVPSEPIKRGVRL